MNSKDTKETLTVQEILERQRLLEEEAGEILSWKFDECTYNKGYIRQLVYACKTCKPNEGYGPGGVCYSCSISCHADHELVELFPKRNFKCDCGTARLGRTVCKLEAKPPNTLNEHNKYDHNYEGRFCWCKVDYDPEKEENNMLQCVICEDWFHENCISGEKQEEKRFSIPDLDTFEEFMCHKCLDKYSFLKPYLNSHMFFSGQYNKKTHQVNEVDENSNDSSTGDKMSQPPNSCKDNETTTTQTSTVSPSSPTPHVNNKRKIEKDEVVDGKALLPKRSKNDGTDDTNVCKRERWPVVNDDVEVDLFCVQGWRDELCRCSKCIELYKKHQIEFILNVEETYEPPEDDDAQKSLFDCGMKALNQMDRVAAIEGILAYNQFKDELIEFLKPFGESGKTVTVKDVNEFFEAKFRDRKPATGSFF
ncbi:6875_t:CDS:10 [Funneliformis caledonium]|uniref:6875_t:CDS:1 n=1 Tax=Funneliformis caledonium TaxID=1117310 RepID=A0A9N9DEA9_9GLOM|nr:6875_t:CDS:10 [Funneliformis caledonium]